MSEDKSLADFGSKALRGPKKGALDQALSWYFFNALKAKPLEKIIKTYEILRMLTESQLKDLDIEISQFETYNILAHTFANPAIFTRNVNGRAIVLNWPFSINEETWQKYFAPWNPLAVDIIYYIGYNESLQKTIDYYHDNEDWGRWLIAITKAGLGEATYNALSTRFIDWAFPDVMRALSKIATIIEPAQFLEMANLDQAQKKEPEPDE